MLQRIIFSLFFIAAMASCKKSSLEFSISGKVNDNSFHSPLVNASVELYKVPPGGGNHELMAKTATDSEGKFKLNFERNKAEKYIIKINQLNYFPIQEDIKFADLDPKKEFVKDFSTTAKSWVKLVFINIHPETENNTIRFYMQRGKTKCEECCTNDKHILTDISDTTFLCISDGGTEYSYYYEIPSMGSIGVESIMTIPFDTVTITKQF